MNMIDKQSERYEIEALLPWYAAGTLSRHDADRVEQALAGDPELARRYDLVRQELAETIHLNETLGVPSARAMEKLFAAIDAEEADAPRRQRRRISRRPSLATAFGLNNDR
jgi:anti-sigma factor RsiW